MSFTLVAHACNHYTPALQSRKAHVATEDTIKGLSWCFVYLLYVIDVNPRGVLQFKV